MTGDGENGGDGVEGEDDVGKLDGDEGEGEDGDHAAVGFANEKAVLAQTDGVNLGEPFEPARRVGFFCGAFGEEQADSGYEKDGCEDVADPMEAGQQAEAGGDEGSAHEDGPGNSPEEDFGLVGRFDFEEAEEEQEDEEIVDGERLFDGVAGKVLGGGLGT
jgi:hypothetical protein